jgi:hypothetical protein
VKTRNGWVKGTLVPRALMACFPSTELQGDRQEVDHALQTVSRQLSFAVSPLRCTPTYIAAAIQKKGVPVDVVTEKANAVYILRSAPVGVKSESTGGKIARCLFAYCAGIEDKGNVSVQLIEVASTKMIWAYSVNKQRGGSKNQQSMAEAIAKHFKEFLPNAPAVSAAPAPVAAQAPAPAPAAPVVTPVAYQPLTSRQPGLRRSQHRRSSSRRTTVSQMPLAKRSSAMNALS